MKPKVELENYKIKEKNIAEALKKLPPENPASDQVGGASTNQAQNSSAPQQQSVPDPANAPPTSGV